MTQVNAAAACVSLRVALREAPGWDSQNRGLGLQDGLGSGAALELHGLLRPVPGGEVVVEVWSSAQVAVQTHAAPLPLQLPLNLSETRFKLQQLLKIISEMLLCF